MTGPDEWTIDELTDEELEELQDQSSPSVSCQDGEEAGLGDDDAEVDD